MLVANRYRKTISASSSRKRSSRSIDGDYFLSLISLGYRSSCFFREFQAYERSWSRSRTGGSQRETATVSTVRLQRLPVMSSCVHRDKHQERTVRSNCNQDLLSGLPTWYIHALAGAHARAHEGSPAVAQRASSWCFRRTIRRTAPFPIFNWLSSLNPSHSPSFLSNFHPLAFRERI